MRIGLFDMDGTIIDGSAVLGHCGFLVEQGIIEDQNGIYKAWELDMKNEEKIMACGEFYRSATTGLHPEDLMIDEYVNQDHKYYEEVINKFKKLKEEGFRTIIISGSTNDLVQGFVKKLGFSEGYGALYKTDKLGRYTGQIEFATFKSEVKKEIINGLIPHKKYVKEIIGFGDTSSDIAIEQVSDKFYLVEPSESTLTLYRELGLEFEVIL